MPLKKLIALIQTSVNHSWKVKMFVVTIGFLLIPLPIDNLKFLLLSVVCVIGSIDILKFKEQHQFNTLFIFGFPIFSFVSIAWSTDPSLAIAESFRWVLLTIFSYIVYLNILRDKKIGVSISTILSSIFIFYLIFHLIAIQLDTALNFEWNALMAQNKNYTSSLLVCIFPFLLFYRSNNQFVRFLKIISTLLIINLLVHTGARGAMLAMAAVLLLKLYDFYSYTNWRFLIVLFFMGAIVYGIHFMNTSSTSDDLLFVKEYREQLDSRVGLNKLSIAEIANTPLIGTGAGQWSRKVYKNGVSELIQYNNESDFIRHRSHNLYFKTFTELGIIGFILLFGFISYVLLKTKRQWTTENTFTKAAWVCLLSVLITNYFYADAISHDFFFSGIIFLGYISIGILLTKINISKNNLFYINGLLIGFSLLCLAWFAYSKYNWDKYLKVQESIEAKNTAQTIELLNELYHPFFNASHRINVSLPHLLANQNVRIKDYNQAEKYFKQALQLSPNHEPLLLSYAQFLAIQQNNSSGALRYVEKILTVQNNHTETLELKRDLLKTIEER